MVDSINFYVPGFNDQTLHFQNELRAAPQIALAEESLKADSEITSRIRGVRDKLLSKYSKGSGDLKCLGIRGLDEIRALAAKTRIHMNNALKKGEDKVVGEDRKTLQELGDEQQRNQALMDDELQKKAAPLVRKSQRLNNLFHQIASNLDYTSQFMAGYYRNAMASLDASKEEWIKRLTATQFVQQYGGGKGILAAGV